LRIEDRGSRIALKYNEHMYGGPSVAARRGSRIEDSELPTADCRLVIGNGDF